MKSSQTCESNEDGTLTTCVFKVHWNRPFETSDSDDYQMDVGLYKGYEIGSFYRITHRSGAAAHADFSELDYILMGASTLAQSFLAAAAATYIAFAF